MARASSDPVSAPVLPKDWPAANSEARLVAKLVPYARNARTHSKGQVAKIAAAIREWGWTMPVLIDEQDGVIAGHGRLLAAELLGIEVVPTITARGWSEAQKRAYVIADNQLAMEAGWDRNLLGSELLGLRELGFDLALTGFDDLDLKGLVRGDALQDDDSKIPALSNAPATRLGDLWMLDRHRVQCGDSTDPKAVTRLLNGETPLLMVTDPPYGVDYDPHWRKEAGVNKGARMGKVKNDDRVDWTPVWRLFPGSVAYVWHAGLHAGEVGRNLVEAGLLLRSQIMWSKSRFALSRGNYHWQHEPCWYAVREGKNAAWTGGRKEATVWEISHSGGNEEVTVHGTQKPLECMGRPMRNHDAAIVFDPFLGSGSTLVAAHLQERLCYGMDLDARYVDMAVGRWQNHTQREAVLQGDGRTFAEIKAEREAKAWKRKAAKKKP